MTGSSQTNNKILEYVIVLNIVLLILALGLPRLFSMRTKFKHTEAVRSLSSLDKAVEACMMMVNRQADRPMEQCVPAYNEDITKKLGILSPFSAKDSSFSFLGGDAGYDKEKFQYYYYFGATLNENPLDKVILFRNRTKQDHSLKFPEGEFKFPANKITIIGLRGLKVLN